MQREDNLENSCTIFYKWAKRGKIVGQIKTKYDTTRWYANLYNTLSVNDFFYPMHYYYKVPDWCRYIDHYFLTPIFGKLMGKWRKFCYRQAYIECGKKFGPLEHVMDWDDLFTPEELEKITTMKWEKYE